MKTFATTFALFIILLFSGLRAQIVEKAVEINPDFKSDPKDFTVYNSKLYFSAIDKKDHAAVTSGREFFVTDGTPAGTHLVKLLDSDFNGGSSPSGFTEFNSKLFFATNDGRGGAGLWTSDGTQAGTVLIKPIDPTGFGTVSDVSKSFIIFQNKLYIAAFDGTNGNELWVSDGTPGGTQLVKDIDPRVSAYGPNNFTVFGDKLFFTMDDSTHGEEPWITDGTPNGTQLLKDIDTNGTQGSAPWGYTPFNNKLYFWAQDLNGGPLHPEIWETDGTTNGTKLFANTFPMGSTDPDNIGVLGDKLYFTSCDTSRSLILWKSDGTTAGTEGVAKINGIGVTSRSGFTIFKNKLYFADYSDSGILGVHLWVSDGTNSGTHIFEQINMNEGSNPGSFTIFKNKLYFIAEDKTGDRQLWVTEGSEGNVKMLAPDSASHFSPLLSTIEFKEYNGALYFSADYDGHGTQLWRVRDTATASVNHPNAVGNISLYPNPAHAEIHLDIKEPVTAVIYNLLGEVQIKVRLLTSGTIDVSNLPRGTYIIREEENSVQAVFIKE
jgi:ELWxxDGT repeat protein